MFVSSAKTNELGTPLATLRQRLFFKASSTSTPNGNFPNANPSLSAKDLSAEGSINEVLSTAQQFHQAKLLSRPKVFHQERSAFIKVLEKLEAEGYPKVYIDFFKIQYRSAEIWECAWLSSKIPEEACLKNPESISTGGRVRYS